jgi:hypothetical protein
MVFDWVFRPSAGSQGASSGLRSAAVIGGIVLLGSNAATWTQTDAALRAAEAMRADLIGRMDLRMVGEEKSTLH